MEKNIIAFIVFSLLSPYIAFSQPIAAVPNTIAQHEGPVRVAIIRNLCSDDSTMQFVTGAVEEGEKLGFEVRTFYAQCDDARFQDLVSQAIAEKYDGIILSYGKAPYVSRMVKQIAAAGIKLSLFETPVDMPIKGVTVTSQDDGSLAQVSMGQLIDDFNGKANIIKLWVPGYPPMERRQVIYEKLLNENPGINQLESAGAVSSNVPKDTAEKMNAILMKYPKGKIDAIWGSWDAFSQGAYQALKDNGRNEIKLYSVDVSNRDLQMMLEKNSPWVLSVAVNQRTVGAVNMRLVALKIGGEMTPETYEFKAATISQIQLKNHNYVISVDSLNNIIPCWYDNRDFIAPWFATLEEKYTNK